MNEDSIRDKILDLLKNGQVVPTSAIQGLTSINFYRLKRILDEMKNEDLIEVEERGTFTYWKLKRAKK